VLCVGGVGTLITVAVILDATIAKSKSGDFDN
jgi:hypothetical protein